MTDLVFNVLFLCTGNSARSILAEALLNREGDGWFRAFSAGSMPTGRVNPRALALVQRLGFAASDFRSKSWEDFARPDAPRLDFVITVCDDAAGEVCPVWPGHPITAHWGVPDPAAATGSEAQIEAAFAEAFRILSHRIRLFVSLPLETLDRLSLGPRLAAIGQTRPEAREP